MIFAKNLRTVRKERGMTQEYLSARCGKPKCWVSNYETGRRGPTVVNLELLREALDCSWEDLLD